MYQFVFAGMAASAVRASEARLFAWQRVHKHSRTAGFALGSCPYMFMGIGNGMRYPRCVPRPSPTAEGFRVALRRPLFTLAEITWRWTAGATAIALFFFGFVEYLRSLPVSNTELLFLRTRQPYLVSQALAHILRGSLGRAVASGLVAAVLIALLWIVAAALGRTSRFRAQRRL